MPIEFPKEPLYLNNPYRTPKLYAVSHVLTKPHRLFSNNFNEYLIKLFESPKLAKIFDCGRRRLPTINLTRTNSQLNGTLGDYDIIFFVRRSNQLNFDYLYYINRRNSDYIYQPIPSITELEIYRSNS